ncbi:7-carboxy-7-deazaguanine synthase QueE [Blattabacterium cuenoti]|uniref:7-carboxy-7-deazaguanine synthase QueE n=1 Tax=Blattabacterium cuenoti TaxID=1653831 RepID=UPI00163CE027|nr:7-carboxy-7-deazaguanine synthase QueE [Blattabacterium cuenoti]
MKSTTRIIFPIKEIFHSIQGEGFYSGISAYFIRLEGCNIQCDWCDTKNSWKIKKKDFLTVTQIVNQIEDKVKTVVITGGEPTMWNLSLLTKILKKKGHSIHIETSGSYPIYDKNIDWITLSPKRKKLPLKENYRKMNELKIVICNEHDFSFAEEQAIHAKKSNCVFILQPEWKENKKILPKIISYIKKNPKWKISLQIHKILNIP